MRMSLWREFRAYLRARCAPDFSHSSISKWHAAVESQMWLWHEFHAHVELCGGRSKVGRNKPAPQKFACYAEKEENAVLENAQIEVPG